MASIFVMLGKLGQYYWLLEDFFPKGVNNLCVYKKVVYRSVCWF